MNLLSESELSDLLCNNTILIIKSFKEYLKNQLVINDASSEDNNDKPLKLFFMFHELNIIIGSAIIFLNKLSLEDDKDKVN